jgi:hypothetical protein
LQSTNPSLRTRAAVKAGNEQDTRAIPLLIDHLEDSDLGVRMFAGMALRKITGKDMKWRFYESVQKRQDAVKRWRQWQEKQVAERRSLMQKPEAI